MKINDKIINIAIIGLGTVGSEVFEYITKEQRQIAEKTGKTPVVKAISARKERNFQNVTWYNNPLDILNDNEIDVIIELIGGQDGIALDIVRGALQKKRHVITANKALIATHGNQLLKIAADNNVFLLYEAAIAGAIPVIKTLKESLAPNKILKINGILNGTCNYILSKMTNNNIDFNTALLDAQNKGFAEADPTLDIDGFDAGHKASILSNLAFGSHINIEKTSIRGIRNINIEALNIAKYFDYKIKLIGKIINNGNNIIQYVAPMLVTKSSKLYNIEDSFNAIEIISDLAQETFLVGHGAGGKPTASSVLSDLYDILKYPNPFHRTIINMNYIDISDIQREFIIYSNDIEKYKNKFNIIKEDYYQGQEIIHVKYQGDIFSDFNNTDLNIYEIHQ